jgi:very-short-patch-repair endonuclease
MPFYRVAETVTATSGRFDVIIVDEASQSGLESLPLLFLADKIIVVGDDQQISPTTFYRQDEVRRIIDDSIRDLPIYDRFTPENSLYDIAHMLFASQVTLIEHFRCMPEIIRFSSNLCYENRPLEPLRQFGADRLEPVIKTVYVPDGYTSHHTNPAEARAVALRAAELVGNPRYRGKSFGIISLVGDYQAKLIERELGALLTVEQLQVSKLLCSGPYGFQGDERDVMLLSMVAAPSEAGPLRTLGDPKRRDTRRFNVAMSRAKDQVWLFHSVTKRDLRPGDLRYRLLEYCLDPTAQRSSVSGVDVNEIRRQARISDRRETHPPKPFDSWFEVDVFLDICSAGYSVDAQYNVAGYKIDIAIVGSSAKLAVECDGDRWHGPDRWEQDAERQRNLERCGWPFWRLRESDYYHRREGALDSLWLELEHHGIMPVRTGADPGAASVLPPTTVAEPQTCTPLPGPAVESVPDVYEPQPVALGVNSPCSTSTEREVDGDELAPASVPDGQSGYPQASAASTDLPPYIEWDGRPLPSPRTASDEVIEKGILQIIDCEGPIRRLRLLDLYRQSTALPAFGGSTRTRVMAAIERGVGSGTIVKRIEGTRTHGVTVLSLRRGPQVRVRERGPRDLLDIPPSETARMMVQRGWHQLNECNALQCLRSAYQLQNIKNIELERLRIAHAMARQLSRESSGAMP